MTDHRLADALAVSKSLEADVSRWYAATENQSERDHALVVRRHITATRKSIEHWIGVRAIRTSVAR